MAKQSLFEPLAFLAVLNIGSFSEHMFRIC